MAVSWRLAPIGAEAVDQYIFQHDWQDYQKRGAEEGPHSHPRSRSQKVRIRIYATACRSSRPGAEINLATNPQGTPRLGFDVGLGSYEPGRHQGSLFDNGGINGSMLKLSPCETAYNTKRGVECYENVKNEGESGAIVIQPLSTGITYQLIPKASVDEVPIFSMGYGRTSAANGKVFPWVFNFPATYWSQATIFVQYIGDREGGMDKLKGKKIALVYHNSAYGKIKTLAAHQGFLSCRGNTCRTVFPDLAIQQGWLVL